MDPSYRPPLRIAARGWDGWGLTALLAVLGVALVTISARTQAYLADQEAVLSRRQAVLLAARGQGLATTSVRSGPSPAQLRVVSTGLAEEAGDTARVLMVVDAPGVAGVAGVAEVAGVAAAPPTRRRYAVTVELRLYMGRWQVTDLQVL